MFELIDAIIAVVMALLAYLITSNEWGSRNWLVPIFVALSTLNLIFDVVPLMMSLQGRTVHPSGPPSSEYEHGPEHVMHAFRRASLFDSKEGFLYNLRSTEIILAPFCTPLGACLAFKA